MPQAPDERAEWPREASADLPAEKQRPRLGSQSGLRLRTEVGVPVVPSSFLIGSREQEVLDTFRAHRAEALGMAPARRSSDPGATVRRAEEEPLRISTIPAEPPKVSRLSLSVVLAAGVVGAFVLALGFFGLRMAFGGLAHKHPGGAARATVTRIPL